MKEDSLLLGLKNTPAKGEHPYCAMTHPTSLRRSNALDISSLLFSACVRLRKLEDIKQKVFFDRMQLAIQGALQFCLSRSLIRTKYPQTLDTHDLIHAISIRSIECKQN